MPFDATSLWWPPLLRLHQQLSTRVANQTSADQISGTLQEYKRVLAKGLGWFCAPNEESKRVLGSEALLIVGSKKLPVDSALRNFALELSNLLNLDELQSYVLLRRWLSLSGQEVVLIGSFSAQQCHSLKSYYAEERELLLTCLGELLQTDPAQGDSDPVVAFTKELIQGGLDASICSAVQALYGPLPPSSQGVSNDGEQQLVLFLADISMEAGPEDSAPEEGKAMLELAILLYTRQGCSCTLQQGIQLLRALKGLVTCGPSGLDGKAILYQHPDHLALVLLMAVLDIGKLMLLVREGRALDAESHRLGTAKARQDVDKELRSWGLPQPSSAGVPTMHAPLLLAWTTFLCLSNSLLPESAEGRRSWEEHADAAWKSGALQSLEVVVHSRALFPATELGEVFRQPLLDVMAAFLGCFSFTPSGLPQHALDAVIGILSGIYEGHGGLCERLWAGSDPSTVPVKRFLDETRSLFPAVTVPFLRLLAATASSSCSANAGDYLKDMPTIACRYPADCSGLNIASGKAEAVGKLRYRGILIGQGQEGVVIPQPASIGKREVIDSEVFVAWDVCGMHGVGFLVLLKCIRSSLIDLAKAVAEQRRGALRADLSAAKELELSLQLLARLTSTDPFRAIEVVEWETIGDSDAPLPELLACAADLLCQLPQPPLSAIGCCFQIAASLAVNLSVKVAESLSASSLLQMCGGDMLGRHRAAVAETRLLSLIEFNSQVEAQAGQYPVTLAVLHLLQYLLQASISHPLLEGLLSYTLTHVLPKHPQWQYEQKSQRWLLASAAIGALTTALDSANSLAWSIRLALNHQGAGWTCVHAAVPPEAGRLVLSSENGAAEAAAVETVVLQWARLLPLLLKEGSFKLGRLSAIFLQVPHGSSGSAAAALASYLPHPTFSAKERGLIIRGIAALAEASAELQHICFAVCLPQSQGSSGTTVDAAIRAELLLPFLSPSKVPAEVFAASCQLLQSAVSHHPSLLEVLLFPTAMDAAEEPSEGTGSPRKGGGQLALIARGHAKKAGSTSRSALDGLSNILQSVKSDTTPSHAVLAGTLQAMLSLWQGGSTTFRAVHLLKSQPGFWKSVVACVPESLQRTLELSGGDKDPAAYWSSQADVAWKYAAEASALQLLTLEAFRSPKPQPGEATAVESVWAALEGENSRRLLELLARYSGPAAGRLLEHKLEAGALLAALQLVASVGGGSELEDFLQLPGSLLGRLSEAAAPLVSCLGQGNAAAGLAAVALSLEGDSLPASGSYQRHLLDMARQLDLGRLLLRSCEMTHHQLHDHAQHLPSYAYSEQKLLHQIGSALAQEVPAVVDLALILRAVNVMRSVETSRLVALQSLKAALVVVSPTAGADLQMSPVDALESTLQPLLKRTEASPEDSPTAVVSERETLKFAVEIAEIATVHIRRSLQDSKKTGMPAAGASLSIRILGLTRSWLQRRTRGHGADSEMEHAVTSSLLIASLTATESCSISSEGLRPDVGKELQQAVVLLLPAICKLVGGGSPHSPTSLALLTVMLTSQLQPDQWLPLLEDSLDLTALLEAAFLSLTTCSDQEERDVEEQASKQDRAWKEAVSVALGGLQLAAVVFRECGGSSCLLSARFFGCLQAISQWLLFPNGGGLLGPDAVSQGEKRGRPAAVRQLWTALLSLQGLLIRSLQGRHLAEQAAVVFAVTAHERLMLALEPPSIATDGSTLSLNLDAIQEASLTLFFLCGLLRLLGRWQSAYLSAPAQARQAATDWLAFAAAPSVDPDFEVSCRLQTTQEGDPQDQQTGQIKSSEGWFGVCASGAKGRNGAPPASAGAAQQGSPLSACTAEAIYRAAAHAAIFVAASSPQIGEEEAKTMGPDYPSQETLLGLQQQCIALGFESSQQRGHGHRFGFTIRMLLMATVTLQDQLRFPREPSHNQQIAEAAMMLKRTLAK